MTGCNLSLIHIFGAIRPRVAAYMKDLDETLWALGVLSKTKHNEVAPAQHEMAPVFSDANSACDQNQLAMEMMKKVADRHGLVLLLPLIHILRRPGHQPLSGPGVRRGAGDPGDAG